MARTNEQIDHLNTFRGEADKLPYEDENGNPIIQPELTPEQIQAKLDEEEAAKKLAAEFVDLEAQKKLDDEKAAQELIQKEENEKVAKIKGSLTDDEKAEIAKQFLGVTDLSELVKKSEIKAEPTKEELEASAQKREDNKLAYALSNGLVKKAQYEEFIRDTKDPLAIVFAQYKAEQLAEDNSLTEEDIQTEFDAKFGLDAEPDTRKYKRGLKEINLLADNLIKAKHAAIFEVDNKYAQFETNQSSKAAENNKILTQAPIYKKDIESVFTEIKSFPVQISETEVHQVELDENTLKDLKDGMLTNDFSTNQILRGYTKEEITQIAKNAAIVKDLPILLKKYADKELLAHQAGLRGIIPAKNGTGKVIEKELTDAQKKALNFAFPQEQQVAN